MRVRRFLILVVGAIGIFYAAAYAAANPETNVAIFVVCGAALLVLAWPVLHLLKVGQIIKNAFSEDD